MSEDTVLQRMVILETALELVSEDRHKQYGDAKINMACAKELKRVFWKYYMLDKAGIAFEDKSRGSAFEEAIDMAITKLSRIACGRHHQDNFVDCSAYIALAFESAEAVKS